PVQRSETDVGHVVNAAVAEVRASYNDVDFKVDASGGLAGRWDSARLAQALTNLISNAAQHGDTKKPISISARGDDSEVMIAVCNGGATIPAERLKRIFDGPKPGGHTNRDREHLGLGLFIVKKIVDGHGGSIDVRSANEQTTF